MPDVRTIEARSFTFIDDGAERGGRFSFALNDGSCLYVCVTPSMAALANAQIADFVSRAFGNSEKK